MSEEVGAAMRERVKRAETQIKDNSDIRFKKLLGYQLTDNFIVLFVPA